MEDDERLRFDEKTSSLKKKAHLRESERGKEDARNLISEGLSCLSSKKQSQNLVQNQKREILKLNEKVRQYEKIVVSKNIIIDELEKELDG